MSSKLSSLDQEKDFKSQLKLILWTAQDAVPENACDPLLRRVTGKMVKPWPLDHGQSTAQRRGLGAEGVPGPPRVSHADAGETCVRSLLFSYIIRDFR